MIDKSSPSNSHLPSLSNLRGCIQTLVRDLFPYPILANPTVPDLPLIRQWLLDEGSISKADLIKLVKDTTRLLSNKYINND